MKIENAENKGEETANTTLAEAFNAAKEGKKKDVKATEEHKFLEVNFIVKVKAGAGRTGKVTEKEWFKTRMNQFFKNDPSVEKINLDVNDITED